MVCICDAVKKDKILFSSYEHTHAYVFCRRPSSAINNKYVYTCVCVCEYPTQ